MVKDTVAYALLDFSAEAEGESGFLKVIEDPKNVKKREQEDRSNYIPGDDFDFIVHHEDRVKIIRIKSSAGEIEYPAGNFYQSRETEEELIVGQIENEHDLSFIPSSSLSVVWERLSRQPSIEYDAENRKVIFDRDRPAVGVLKYSYQALLVRLKIPEIDIPSGESMKINIVVDYELIDE